MTARRPRKTDSTPENSRWPLYPWAESFLQALSMSCDVTAAAKFAGMDRGLAYKLRHADPEFAQAWRQTLVDGIDLVEQEAFRRALDPASKSDVLLIFLLKSHRPDVYRETIRVDLVAEARRLAAQYGLSEADAVEEAEALLRGS